MKSMKKLASILLSLVMALAMAVPSFAAEGDLTAMEGPLAGGTITINQATKNQTYELYQIMYLESYNKTTGKYSYKVTEAWKNYLKTGEGNTYFTVDTNGYVTWNFDPTANARAQEFAQKALAHAKAEAAPIAPVATQNATGTTVQFTELKLGYYLVDTTVGTICILNTTNPTINMNDKNQPASNEKTVQENGSYRFDNDVSIGAPIHFKSTIGAGLGATNYVFHDKADTGFDFIGIDKILKNNQEDAQLRAYDPANPDNAWDYKLIKPADDAAAFTGDCADCTFHVEFNQTFLNTLTTNDSMDVFYTAKLNQRAVAGKYNANDGNINTSWLTYGKNGDIRTLNSSTTTKTWQFTIFKYDGAVAAAEEPVAIEAAAVPTPLSGAVFKLCKANSDGSAPGENAEGLKLSKVANVDGHPTYKLNPDGGTVTEFSTETDGYIVIQGLDAATYFLYETTAPAGYNKLKDPVNVTITKEGIVKRFAEEARDKQTIGIPNGAGSLMPSTGGIGTTIFYIVGGVLLVGAGVLLVVRKRMSGSKEAK